MFKIFLYFVVIVVIKVTLFAQTPQTPTFEKEINCNQSNLPSSLSNIAEFEMKLCQELNTDSNLQEIYGFIRGKYFGQIIRIYKNKAVFTNYNDYARYQEKEINKSQIEEFNKLLEKIKPENQPAYIRGHCTDMCFNGEFISIKQQNSNRIYIASGSIPSSLNLFRDLFNE